MTQMVILTLADLMARKQPVVLATVVEVQGASPARPGTQILLAADGTTVGTAGGGNLEAAILADAQAVLWAGQPRLAHYTLKEEGPESVGVLCGGEVRVFYQPYLPPPRLVIVGGGHIGRPLQVMGEAAGFEVTVVDVLPDRKDVSSLESDDLTDDSYVVLITTDHVSDEAALRQALPSPAPYIGMIGSRAKCRTILDRLRADGYADEALARVHAPIGLDLGGPTAEEIAVAILAEIIATRRGKLAGREKCVGLRREPMFHLPVADRPSSTVKNGNHEN